MKMGGDYEKRYQIEKYTILFAIGGMAYFCWKFSTDIHIIRCFYVVGMFPCCGLLNKNVKDQDKFY